MPYGRQYSEAERRFIAENAHRGYQWLMAQLGLTYNQISGYFGRHKLTTGNDGRFKQGLVPHNKGKKMPTDLYEKCRPTMFRKGVEPPSTAPEGDLTCRVRVDNRGQPNLMIRVRLGVWQFMQRYVWETFNGPVPAGMLVTFLDGNPLNCHPDNLRLMDRYQNLRRNYNREKFSQTMRSLYATGRISNPLTRLDDSFVLQTLTHDPVEKQRILTKTPKLIPLQRSLMQLNRELRKAEIDQDQNGHGDIP